MSKPTKNEFKSLLDKTFPITGSDPTANSLVKIQRAACETMLDKLDEFFKKDETEYLEGLRRSLVAENDKLKKEKEELLVKLADKKIEISEKDKEIANLKTEKVEAEHRLEELQYRSQHTERIIKNRTEAVMAEANKRINDAVPINVKEELEDYRTLLASVKASEKQDLAEYSTRWRVLTRAVIEMNMTSPRFALFARADGNYILCRWGNIAAMTGSPKCEGFDKTPFTHYMSIPKTSLQYLVNGPSQEPDICDGCPHHVTDPNNPNKCVLPGCIKDYTISRSAVGKSSNNTPN